MTSQTRLLTLLTFLLAGCTQNAGPRPEGIPKTWVLTKDANNFSFWHPPEMKEERLQGVDSSILKLVSPSMTLTTNFGWHGDLLSDPKYQREPFKLDGRDAYLLHWSGGIGLMVPEVSKVKGFSSTVWKMSMLITCEKAAEAQAEKIIRTIKFGIDMQTPSSQ